VGDLKNSLAPKWLKNIFMCDLYQLLITLANFHVGSAFTQQARSETTATAEEISEKLSHHLKTHIINSRGGQVLCSLGKDINDFISLNSRYSTMSTEDKKICISEAHEQGRLFLPSLAPLMILHGYESLLKPNGTCQIGPDKDLKVNIFIGLAYKAQSLQENTSYRFGR
jgi:hypothetical protein